MPCVSTTISDIVFVARASLPSALTLLFDPASDTGRMKSLRSNCVRRKFLGRRKQGVEGTNCEAVGCDVDSSGLNVRCDDRAPSEGDREHAS